MLATQGLIPLEEDAFATGLVEEAVQEKKQTLRGQNCYDDGEQWSDV